MGVTIPEAELSPFYLRASAPRLHFDPIIFNFIPSNFAGFCAKHDDNDAEAAMPATTLITRRMK